jgi:hypothetical protein
MRKIGIVLALALTSYTANALELPKVEVAGKIDFQAGAVKQKKPFMYTSPANTSIGGKVDQYGFVNDTALDIKIDGTMAPGITYGGYIRAHGDTSVATNKEIYFGDKSMIYFQHNKFGRIEGGNTPGAGGLFEMDTVNLMEGTFGIDGFWSQWVTDKSLRTSKIYQTVVPFFNVTLATVLENAGYGGEKSTRGFEFIASPNIVSNYSGHYYSDAPKINLFTKPIEELTLGISYIPDLDAAGTVSNPRLKNEGPQDDRKGNPATYRNIFSGGFVYENKHLFTRDFGIKTGAVGEIGKSKLSYMNKLRSYEVGLMFTYKNIRWGSTYGSWMDSLTPREKTTGGRHGSSYYTFGVAQNFEKLGYSITAMESRKGGGVEILGYQVLNANPFLTTLLTSANINAQSFADPKKNKFRNIAFDVEYKLAPGFLPYIGVSCFKFNESHGAKDQGYVWINGVRLTF